MSAQIAGLWGLSGVDAALLALLLSRFGGLLPLFRRRRTSAGDIDELVGTRLPPLRFRPASAGEPSAGRPGRFENGSLVLFVAPRCVASYRLCEVFRRVLEPFPAGFPIVFALVGTDETARRLLSSFPFHSQAVIVTPSRFTARFADSIPFAVAAGDGGTVVHAGLVDSEGALEKFIEASGSPLIRRWFSTRPAVTQAAEHTRS
jgi:hypothetical protein